MLSSRSSYPVPDSGHCCNTRVRWRIVSLIRGRCLIALANMSRALSRLSPANSMRSASERKCFGIRPLAWVRLVVFVFALLRLGPPVSPNSLPAQSTWPCGMSPFLCRLVVGRLQLSDDVGRLHRASAQHRPIVSTKTICSKLNRHFARCVTPGAAPIGFADPEVARGGVPAAC
jgi:hypothetical protein